MASNIQANQQQTAISSTPVDPFAGCLPYIPTKRLTDPGTEYGFLEVPKPRSDRSGYYTYLQCKYRSLIGGTYVYCHYCPRRDHFGTGKHVHKIPKRQRTLQEMLSTSDVDTDDLTNAPCPELYEALAKYAARANVALEKVVGPDMWNIIITVADWTLRNASELKAQGKQPIQIFRPITRRTLRKLILKTANSVTAEKLRLIKQHRYATILMDAGQVRRNHWLDFIVKIGRLEAPFDVKLIPSLDTAGYREQALRILSLLRDRGVQICAFVGDGLLSQVHALNGRHDECFQKLKTLPDPQWKRIIFSPCWVHRVQLTYRHIYKQSKDAKTDFAALIDGFHVLASRLRKYDARVDFARVCPAPVETRWLYIFDVAEFVFKLRHAICDFLDRKGEGGLCSVVNEAVNLMKLLEPFRSLTLELSGVDARICDVFPLVRLTEERLYALEFQSDEIDFGEIRDSMAEELLRVTLGSYEGPMLVAAHLLRPEGKKEYSENSMAIMKVKEHVLPNLIEEVLRINAESTNRQATLLHGESLPDSVTDLEEEEDIPDEITECPEEVVEASGIAGNPSLASLRDKGKLLTWGKLGIRRLAGDMQYPVDGAVSQFIKFLRSDISTIPNYEVFDDENCELIWNLIMEEGLHDWVQLARIAERIVCIPASEVPCERAFSLQGYIQTKRNERSKPDLLVAKLVHICNG